jgi:hypothetical protein
MFKIIIAKDKEITIETLGIKQQGNIKNIKDTKDIKDIKDIKYIMSISIYQYTSILVWTNIGH